MTNETTPKVVTSIERVADYAVWRSGTDPERAILVPATSAFDARRHMAKAWGVSVTEVLARRYR